MATEKEEQRENETNESLSFATEGWGAHESEMHDSLSMAEHCDNEENLGKETMREARLSEITKVVI